MLLIKTIGRKKGLFVIILILVALSFGVFCYMTYFRDKNPDHIVRIEFEKETYLRGEPVVFFIKNVGTKPVQYLVPPSKCEAGFQWSLLMEKEGSWNSVRQYPDCGIGEEDYDLVEIRTLNPGETINDAWDQKLVQQDVGSRYAETGKHKVVFYYSSRTINKGDVRNGAGYGMESASSSEFSIGGDFFDDYVKTQIRKENDAERKNDLSEIMKGLEAYYDKKEQRYPESNGFVKLNDKNSLIYKDLSRFVQEGYLSDPNQPEYYYGYNSDGSNFELSARLENADDGSCEVIGESLCIYKTDSAGNVSQKKYVPKQVFTIGESVDDFILEVGIFDDPENIIMITSSLIGASEKAMIEEANVPENVRTIRAGEVEEEDLSGSNLVVIGNSVTNIVIADIYKKVSMIEVADMVDFEKNKIKAVFRFAKNPWNDKKKILVVDLGYSIEMFQRMQGSLKSEKDGEYYHIVFNPVQGGTYALVRSFERGGSGIGNMNEFEGKNIEIYGYRRMINSQEFPIEDSLGVIDINILD